MARMKLTLGNLKDLDMGKVSVQVERLLGVIAADIDDRPMEDQPRSLMLQIDVRPEEVTAGSVDTVLVDFAVKHKLPPFKSNTRSMSLQKGLFIFNTEDADNAKQLTLDEQQ